MKPLVKHNSWGVYFNSAHKFDIGRRFACKEYLPSQVTSRVYEEIRWVVWVVDDSVVDTALHARWKLRWGQ